MVRHVGVEVVQEFLGVVKVGVVVPGLVVGQRVEAPRVPKKSKGVSHRISPSALTPLYDELSSDHIPRP